jgi:hypothetical protein
LLLLPAALPHPPPLRSVSYVPAAYYAHLAAFRGRLMKREADEGSVVSSGSGERAPEVLQIPVSSCCGGGVWAHGVGRRVADVRAVADDAAARSWLSYMAAVVMSCPCFG